jgi:hypothetical protein
MMMAYSMSHEDEWTLEAIQRAQQWCEEAKALSKDHHAAALKYRKYHLIITGVHAAVSAATGAVGVGMAPCPSGFLVAGLSALTTALTGAVATVAWNVRSESHDRSADDLTDIARYIDYQLALPPRDRDRPKTVFVFVASRLDAVENMAPLV